MSDAKIRDAIARRFGAALKSARARAGITQPELAEASTVSLPAIARYESGKRAPGLAEALLLAKALDLSLDDLA
jgi:transcriptional regulator with XRE-family HTH domain